MHLLIPQIMCLNDGQDTSEPVNKKKKQKSADGGPETTEASVTEVGTSQTWRNAPEA
jgi:hypothetical protein